MSGIFDEALATAIELLGTVGDTSGETFGEDVTITRPGTGGYDSTTRTMLTGPLLSQTLRGTFESVLSASPDTADRNRAHDSLALRYERVCTVIPSQAEGAFEPRVGDRLLGDGATWKILENAPVRGQGVAVLWILGLESA